MKGLKGLEGLDKWFFASYRAIEQCFHRYIGNHNIAFNPSTQAIDSIKTLLPDKQCVGTPKKKTWEIVQV